MTEVRCGRFKCFHNKIEICDRKEIILILKEIDNLILGKTTIVDCESYYEPSEREAGEFH